MKKMRCAICGYIHDESKEGAFADLPEGWVCPLCTASKSVFAPVGEEKEKPSVKPLNLPTDDKELSSLELSILLSNLARGCEKQYLPKEMALFRELSNFFKAGEKSEVDPSMEKLIALVEKDLNENIETANAVSFEAKDRGAMRALVWSGKVTAILQSILDRVSNEGEAMIEQTHVYVCTICGFIYIGDTLPALCPICKVPNDKFEEVKGEK